LQGYLTCEKAEQGREISERVGAKGSAKKGQKRRELTPKASGFVGGKTIKNKKGWQDKISQPIELYGRDGVIRTLDP
jgi:hypothetical protein